MLGSVERMAAVLTEHWAGKWPFWISPRQCMIVPIDPIFNDYACNVQKSIHDAGFYVDVDDSTHTLGKKVREAQLSQYNLILVVGEEEVSDDTVCVRVRNSKHQQKILVKDVIAKMNVMSNTYTEYMFE
jgi:threonyl-tRNA synthetase